MRWRYVKQGKIKKPLDEKKPKVHYASIFERLKAFLTDTFMITTPIVYIVIYFIMGSREEFRAHMGQGWLFIIVPHALIVTLLWWLKGQTPGMKLYEMEVRRWNDPAKPINLFQALIRYLAMPISILSIVGLLIAFFREDRATFHDLISFSRIVKVENISTR